MRNCVSEGLDWSQVWGLAVTQVLSAWQIFANLAVLHSIACVCDSKHVRDVSVSRSGGASQRSVATPVIGKAEISGGVIPILVGRCQPGFGNVRPVRLGPG